MKKPTSDKRLGFPDKKPKIKITKPKRGEKKKPAPKKKPDPKKKKKAGSLGNIKTAKERRQAQLDKISGSFLKKKK